MSDHAVVIAGGGPTGLMLAAELALVRVDVAIVERRPNQDLAGSRAGGLHARTIELLDQRGVAERFLSQGKVMQVAGFALIPLDISDFPLWRPRALKRNRMVHQSSARLDASFAALSDATRRGVLAQLGRGDASITELADKFHMTLTGMKKHVGVLERAGLVATEKVGRVRTCRLGPSRLESETAWMETYRRLWAARFEALDEVLEELQRKETVDARKKRH